jgi:O-antigen biosynthesis protein
VTDSSGPNSFRFSFWRALYLLRSGKFREFFSALTRRSKNLIPTDEDEQYQKWIEKNESNESEHIELQVWCSNLSNPPLVSFILRNGDDQTLINQTVESLQDQYYGKWELLISESDGVTSQIHDDRVHFVPQAEISKNTKGEWLAPISQGDVLSPKALGEVFRVISDQPNLDFIYTDHDLMNNDGKRSDPFFKPEWSPEFLNDLPYTSRLSVYRSQLIPTDSLFWIDEQSWLKYFASRSVRAVRIPKVLYHFSRKPEFNMKPQSPRIQNPGSISILIPTHDQPEKLKCAVNSILRKSTYSNYEIVILNNASVQDETLQCFDELRKNNQIKIIDYPQPFNFAAINNFGVSKVASDYVLFLNDDTEVISPSWLEAMMEYAQKDLIGAVGAKLLYRNNTIQHGGILIGQPEIAVHAHKGFPKDSEGYQKRLISVQNFSAVTAACMMMRQNLFLEAKGFDENLPLAYNDVDLCLKLLALGKRIVWTPHAELFHDESQSRGLEVSLEKQKRLSSETDYFLQRWKDVLEKGDPYYNPNLSLENGAFKIRL